MFYNGDKFAFYCTGMLKNRALLYSSVSLNTA
jgi:hypothetical protein